jgi:hypothetical protein
MVRELDCRARSSEAVRGPAVAKLKLVKIAVATMLVFGKIPIHAPDLSGLPALDARRRYSLTETRERILQVCVAAPLRATPRVARPASR